MAIARRRGLARLMLRWPERRAQLQERVACDQSLSELCEAYETACEAMSYWAKSKSPISDQRTEEYRILVAETEDDILRRLVKLDAFR